MKVELTITEEDMQDYLSSFFDHRVWITIKDFKPIKYEVEVHV